MKILITGATGLVGRVLTEKLIRDGHEIIAITRNLKHARDILPSCVEIIQADLNCEVIKHELIKTAQAVVHLMGENVMQRRWNEKIKEDIARSRITATENLIKSLGNIKLEKFISASAIGIYCESLGENILDELSPQDKTFLANICEKWEQAVLPIENKTSTTIFRIGVVLGRDDGMYKEMMPLFRACLGGVLGQGKRYLSWIHVDDLVLLITKALFDQRYQGVINAVAPNACTYQFFTKKLSELTQRKAYFKVPSWFLRLVLGERSQILLANYRIHSNVLSKLRHEFLYPSLESALEDLTCYKQLDHKKKAGFHYCYRTIQFIKKRPYEIFPFFSDAKNLEQITPPLLHFKILNQSTPQIELGTEFNYRLQVHGIPIKWKTHIIDWNPNSSFIDYQANGPYHTWHHTHSFFETPKGTLMVDEVLYRLPFGFLGDLFGRKFVKNDVEKIFNYRKQIIEQVFHGASNSLVKTRS
jgi:uncharacterized protein